MSRLWISKAAAVVALTMALAVPITAEADGRARLGLAIAPVPLDTNRWNRRLVGLGSYIVNAQGMCNVCHTFPQYAADGDPFLGEPEQINTDGYMCGGRPFGPIVSTDISPDQNGLPAGLTRREFIRLMRTGEDDGELLQVMPWPIYGKMARGDLSAVYAYLTAIPSCGG